MISLMKQLGEISRRESDQPRLVSYMENIRSITERLRSCISCGESRCPFIKERLDNHVTSHHHTFKRSFSSQHIPSHQKWSKMVYTSRTNMLPLKLNEHTSTSNLIAVNKPEADTEQLRNIILKCLKYITINKQPGDVNVQNIINEFTDKISKPSLDYTDVNYGPKLNDMVDDFIASLPLNNNNQENDIMNLKARIATKITNFNRKTVSSNKKNTITNTNDDKYYFYNKYTSTDFVDNNKTIQSEANVDKTEINTLDSPLDGNDSVICYKPLELQNNSCIDNELVETEVPNGFTNNMLSKETEMQRTLDKYNTQDNEETVYDNTHSKCTNLKKYMTEWLLQLNYEANLNISCTNMHFILEELYNRLLPLINTKSEILDIKLCLQEEVLNFFNEYFNIEMTRSSIARLNKCAENLAILLLIDKSNSEIAYLQQLNTYFFSNFEKNIGVNEEIEKIKPLLSDIVTDNLDKYYSGYKSIIIINEIIEFILQHLYLVQRQDDYEFKDKLLDLLKSLTDLSDNSVSDIVNDIVKRMKCITVTDNSSQNYSTTRDSKGKYPFRNVITVFKSETELLDRSNNNSNILNKKRNSTIKKKINSKTDTEIQLYTEKLGDLIMAWINTLPPQKFKKSKKMKETLGNKLVEDILDQIHLERMAPEICMERDKYLCFFINRWLNRYEYFDDIRDAKPYVDLLLEKIKDISIPISLKSRKNSDKELSRRSLEESATTQRKYLVFHEMSKLTNEISQWVNEQPVQFFSKDIMSVTNELNHKITSKLQDKNKSTRNQIANEIKNWLNELVTPEHKPKIAELAETLNTRIDNIIIDNNHEKLKSKQIIDESLCCDENITDMSTVGLEETAKQLVAKFVEHKYDSENFIAREACAQLIKKELQKLIALSRLDPNMSTSLNEHETSVNKLSKELQYIRIISDCLKRLPLQESFSKTENSIRAEHVNTLAKIINDIDENKHKLSSEEEYNYHLTLKITDFLKTLHMPIQFENTMPVLVNELIIKILASQRHSPCCSTTRQSTSTNTGVFDLTLSDYIEAYIHENDEEIFDDDLKLEACISRLFSEINTMNNKNSASCRASCIPSNIAKRHMPSNETITHFTLEMEYANEISNWLSNLPLLPLTDKDSQNQLVAMINSLAEKMSESNRINKDPNTNIDRDLIDYVSKWISNLPLDPNKEIAFDVVIQQLINRMKRISNETKQQKHQKQIDSKPSKNICKNPNSCRTKINVYRQNRDPGTAMVEAIEEWCNNLPVKAENETATTTLKQNIATKLYQRMGELNMNPEYFNNNILYEEMLCEEIDLQLQNLPQSNKLQNTKKELKEKLLDIIMALRNEIKNKTAGVEYKRDLEKTIEISMPHPVRPSSYREESPGFKIYKDRLATIFILENFDHGNDAVKLNYEKRIRKEIDKYFHEVQDKSSIPLTKDQIYNDLYSALFNVPLPNESSMIDEVEEIKTRCEIDKWFETLPLREPTGVGELLTWDQILSMLASRIHEFEKYDKFCDHKIHKEITKWLVKLPFLPHQANNIDDFTNDLQQRLKATLTERKYIPRDFNKSIIDKSKSTNEEDRPTYNSRLKPVPPSKCCQTCSVQKPKKTADIILDIVEFWCCQLPLPANTLQEKENLKIIKDNLIVKIIMKINEINGNPETFNDDFLYHALLDFELENLISKLPVSYELVQRISSRKEQLKEAIIFVRPLILKEKARYEYKVEIKNTVDKILDDPLENNTDKKILFNCLKEEIADRFIIYNFYKHDEENCWNYKTLFNDSVEQYFTLLDTSNDESIHIHRDPLLKCNQLLCELAKIRTPGENVILEEVQEIEIKFELSKLFDDLFLSQDKDKLVIINQIKASLAQQLNDIIKEGSTCGNYRKIKEYIVMTLKKLDKDIDLQIVDTFIKRLKHCISKNYERNYILSYEDEETQKNISCNQDSSENDRENQWYSLLPESPKSLKTHDHYYNEPLEINESAKKGFVNPQEERQIIDSRFNNSSKSYENFEKGPFLSSSIRPDNDVQNKTKTSEQFTEINSKHDFSCSPICKSDEKSSNQTQSSSFAQTINNISSKPQQPAQSEQRNYLSSSGHTFNDQSLAQGASHKTINNISSKPQQPAQSDQRNYLSQSEHTFNDRSLAQDATHKTINNISSKTQQSAQSEQRNHLNPAEHTFNDRSLAQGASQKMNNNISSKRQQPGQSEQRNNLSPAEHTFNDKSLAQGASHRANKSQPTQTSESQQNQSNFSKSIPDPKTSEYAHTKLSEKSKISTKPQIPNQDHVPKLPHKLQNSSKPTQADRSLKKNLDARGSENVRSQSPQPQQISNKLQRHPRDIQESRPFVSPVPPPSQKPMLYSKLGPSPGQPSRRPSITIFRPTESSIHDEKDQTSQTKCTSEERLSEDYGDANCDCLTTKKRSNICSTHMQRHCRICNGINPIYCRKCNMPPFRYPSFYYH